MEGESSASQQPSQASVVDLGRLRRFALTMALLLLTYALAAVELDATQPIHPLGVPLRIKNPEWLGIGLALATLYAAARFSYFGLMLSDSPKERRRRELAANSIGRGYRATSPRVVRNRAEDVAALTSFYQSLFPRVPWSPVSLATIVEDDKTAQDVQNTLGYEGVLRVVRLRVPLATRLAMLLEEIDYTAPVWFSIAALAAWLVRLLG